MQSRSRLFDDLSRLANGVAGIAAGAGREARTHLRERLEQFLSDGELVSLDAFETLRLRVEAQAAEIADLRAQLNRLQEASHGQS